LLLLRVLLLMLLVLVVPSSLTLSAPSVLSGPSSVPVVEFVVSSVVATEVLLSLEVGVSHLVILEHFAPKSIIHN